MIEPEKEEMIFNYLKEGKTYDFITEKCECSKSAVSEVKRKHPDLFKIKKVVKEPTVKKEIIELSLPLDPNDDIPFVPIPNIIKKSLDSADYKTISAICDRVIKQLRGKIPKNPENSKTADIVVDAYFLKQKLIKLGLIKQITPEIIKEIREVD